jgi:peptidyl-prolyl cis-trans isomerase D
MEEDNSGRLALVWDYMQNSIVNAQFYNKYNALFQASGTENAIQMRRAIDDNNVTSNVEFVMAPHAMMRDTSIVISDQEIKKYYDNHLNFYRQKASREIEYAVFQVVPSAEDIAATNADFVRLYDEFATTDNVRAFLQRNSDRQYTDRWFKNGELRSVNADIDDFVTANASGVSPVYTKDNNFFAARILGQASLPDSVYVRHMLFQGTDANHLADSLIAVLKKGGDFSSLAALYSLDKNSADNGELGNLGFEKETLSSKETFNKFYNDANRLATLAAGSYKNYKAACDSIGIYSHPQTITEATSNYGTINHAKEVTRWAFDHKPGTASNIITVDNNYFFVVAVKKANKEGYADLADVAEQIRSNLYSQRFSEKQAEEVGAKIAGLTDIQSVAEVLGSPVSTQEDVSFASSLARSMDGSFVGAIAGAEVDKLTGPIAGSYGTYVFKVTDRNTGSYYTEEDAIAYRNQVNAYFSQMLLSVMQGDFDVKDYRERFF